MRTACRHRGQELRRDRRWIGRGAGILLSLWWWAVAAGAADDSFVRRLSSQWLQVKGKHFIVFYLSPADRSAAETVLNRSEEYYRRIGETLGYTRYGDFWTWDDRAKIFLFPDQASFVETTGQPAWSTGFSDRDTYVFQSRAIVTYRQERAFYDELLPHEISHLILHDYVPVANIPIWFDEGIAQLQEAPKKDQARRIMRQLVRQGQYIRFSALQRADIRTENEPAKVTVFYAQSLSVVDFLLSQYGRDSFHRLLRNLRDGQDFDGALRRAYDQQIKGLEDLEKQWLNAMSR